MLTPAKPGKGGRPKGADGEDKQTPVRVMRPCLGLLRNRVGEHAGTIAVRGRGIK